MKIYFYFTIFLFIAGIDPDSWDDAWSYDDTKGKRLTLTIYSE